MTGTGTRRMSRRQFVTTTGLAGAVALAGCTSSEEPGSDDGLSGDIRISGSSTVYPVAQEMSRRFAQQNENVNFDITRDGSSGGFENVFIPGDSDINNASRSITESEIQACKDNGFDPAEFFVAQDALTIVVNNENDWIDSISLEELGEVWSPDTKPELWSDVNDDWPDEPFDLYGPATTSGTFDYFTEAVTGEAGKIRSDFEGTEEDDLIAQGVEGSEYAMGYLPFAYYTNNPDDVKALSLIEDGSDPVEPSLEGAQSGNYPLARPLYFYANSEKLQEKAHLEAFVRFYVNSAAEDFVADEIGYVPSSQEMVDENLATLNEYVD
ncbi:ABC-type phosphate transport system, periplasmiccomponent [Halanaeroarchaeum sp. HSR-CO]|uniref:phosphate ABC transporter substrate-binding protein PstS family protein n=1 Tax=Halanaeroarchaeum sp. HSR-CO TaxID=2866382 RepID=UPI00217D2A1F|nr:phosphate ABC transporter substrate-binding protein PstS family protein [Halanaeroarchaeum sp. HSR-CO]UWG47379.1 ABC-type phosphate transport system, periplasmiccomponent [Halanaeroarchaeum sp. HSR-CO]